MLVTKLFKFGNMSKVFKFKLPRRAYSSVLKKDVWDNGVFKSPCKDIVIPKITLNEYIWRNLDKWPSKVAMVSELLAILYGNTFKMYVG